MKEARGVTMQPLQRYLNWSMGSISSSTGPRWRTLLAGILLAILMVGGCQGKGTGVGGQGRPGPGGGAASESVATWTYQATSPESVLVTYRGTHAISDEWVAFVETPADAAHRLVCLELKSGQVLWRREIANGTRFVACGRRLAIVERTGNGQEAAASVEIVEGMSGRSAHTVPLPQPAEVTDLTGSTDRVYLLVGQNVLVCMSVPDGSILWRRSIRETEPGGWLFAAGEGVVHVTPALVSAFSQSGAPLWESEQPAQIGCEPALTQTSSEHVLVAGERGCVALDSASGQVLWTRPDIAAVRQTGLSTADGLCLMGTADALTGLSVVGGNTAWTYALDPGALPSRLASLTCAGGRVFFFPLEDDRDYYLHAISTAKGDECFRDPAPYRVGIAIITNGRFVAAFDLECLRVYDVAGL